MKGKEEGKNQYSFFFVIFMFKLIIELIEIKQQLSSVGITVSIMTFMMPQ